MHFANFADLKMISQFL